MADGRPVGCIMLCQTEEPAVGQLRLFLVEKGQRGAGVGTALVDAIRLYQKYGFHKTEQQPNTTWSLDGETVMEEKFELAL